MTLESRDYVLIGLGASFGVLLLFLSGVSTALTLMGGMSGGGLGAAGLCFATKSTAGRRKR